jgi:hypothetical protein
MITESTYENSSNSLLEEFNWHQLSINRKKLKAILMYKTINKRVPEYLQDIFTSRSCPYRWRNNENAIFVPKPHTDYYESVNNMRAIFTRWSHCTLHKKSRKFYQMLNEHNKIYRYLTAWICLTMTCWKYVHTSAKFLGRHEALGRCSVTGWLWQWQKNKL